MTRIRTRLIVIAMCVSTWACNGDPAVTPPDAQVDATPDAPDNLLPIANAGPDATHLIGGSFGLDGSASSDPDGTLVSFQWSVDNRPAGSTAAIVNALGSVASFTPDEVGTYSFALVVTDDDGEMDRDTVTVIVERGAFTVNAGPDQTVVWRSTVSLSGSYVSESGPGAAKWRMALHPASSSVVPLPATSLTPSFFAEKVGTYMAELEITSPAGIATDTVMVTVVPPPPDLIAGDIVDVEPGSYEGRFMIASVNPPRIRVLAPAWPTPPSEMVIPLSVTPTAIGVSETEQFVSVIHDSTRLTVVSTSSSSQSTLDVGTPLLDVRHGSSTPRAYPAQAGSLLLIDHANGVVYPGGSVPGPARGRERSSGERPLYALDLGPSAKLRRFDGNAQDTAFVREWPYAGGQYPLGNDLWLVLDSLIVSTGYVFHMSEDANVDLTFRAFLAGDQPFEIVGARVSDEHIVTLANRITTPPQLPESQVRFYNRWTLALEHVVPLADLVIGGVPQRTVGRAITNTITPGRFYVIGSAGTTYALFTVPVP